MASNIMVDRCVYIQLHPMPAKEKDVIEFLSIRCLEPQLPQPDGRPIQIGKTRFPPLLQRYINDSLPI